MTDTDRLAELAATEIEAIRGRDSRCRTPASTWTILDRRRLLHEYDRLVDDNRELRAAAEAADEVVAAATGPGMTGDSAAILRLGEAVVKFRYHQERAAAQSPGTRSVMVGDDYDIGENGAIIGGPPAPDRAAGLREALAEWLEHGAECGYTSEIGFTGACECGLYVTIALLDSDRPGLDASPMLVDALRTHRDEDANWPSADCAMCVLAARLEEPMPSEPQTESGRALHKWSVERARFTPHGKYGTELADRILAIEQEAASKAVAEVLDRLEERAREWFGAGPSYVGDIRALIASER